MFAHPLARHLAVIVLIKVAIVIAAGWLVFGPRQRPEMNAMAVTDRLLAGHISPDSTHKEPTP